jgi:zinc transporter 1
MFQYPQILKRVTKQQRILAVIAIAGAFFILEIAIGIKTRSLALVADAFHIFSDLLGYMVAYWAVKLNIDDTSNKTKYTYGYQRSELLGSFFNGGKPGFINLAVVIYLTSLLLASLAL